jgi:ABC-type polysaccharide/polyol phosphate export permease
LPIDIIYMVGVCLGIFLLGIIVFTKIDKTIMDYI